MKKKNNNNDLFNHAKSLKKLSKYSGFEIETITDVQETINAQESKSGNLASGTYSDNSTTKTNFENDTINISQLELGLTKLELNVTKSREKDKQELQGKIDSKFDKNDMKWWLKGISGAAILILGGWYAFLFKPIESKVEKNKSDIEDINSQLSKESAKTKQLEGELQEINKLVKENNKPEQKEKASNK